MFDIGRCEMILRISLSVDTFTVKGMDSGVQSSCHYYIINASCSLPRAEAYLRRAENHEATQEQHM